MKSYTPRPVNTLMIWYFVNTVYNVWGYLVMLHLNQCGDYIMLKVAILCFALPDINQL